MSGGVAVRGLSFRYERRGDPALDAVDLEVEPGEILAVVGPSGSGKTTLLRAVSGLLAPEAGTVVVGGIDVTTLPPERRRVAMVFQGFALFPHLDVAANIGFGLAVRKAKRGERERRVAEVAERLGLGDLLGRRPGEISGGERQRVALARALVRDPLVFCLDEPLSSLDPLLRASARRELDALLRQGGRCAIHVTHDQAEAMTLADRIAVMRDGRVEQSGTPRELYDEPATAFVAAFIGTPPMSVVPAGAPPFEGPPGAARVGVRAEHVSLIPGDQATVLTVEEYGHEQIVELAVGDGAVLAARVPRETSVARGARTGFRIARDRARFFDAAGRAVR